MRLRTALIIIICLNLIVCASTQKKLKKEREKDPEYQYNLSLVHLRNGDFDEAIRILNKALALKPNYNHALCTLGLAYSMKGEFQESINQLKKCLDIDPSMTDAHNYLGVAYQELGFLEEAEKEFKIAILDTKYKSRELPYYNLARIYLTRGNLQEALDHVDRALLFNANFRLAHNLKGMILERQLKYAEAIESYLKALRNLQADSSMGSADLAVEYWVTINFNLGVAYFKNNELQKAKDVFVNIYPKVTDPEMKKQIEKYLKDIK
jgi:tetratricopeptide (TPR) repeat protein